MGILTDYFAAASDAAAAMFIDHGPAQRPLSGEQEIAAAYQAARQSGDREALLAAYRCRLQTAADGTLVVQSKGIWPGLHLDTLESLLTGIPYENIAAGPRSAASLASRSDGDVEVLTVTDELQDALAAADQDHLTQVSAMWSQTVELGGSDPAALTHFVAALAELARAAIARGERLYCWVSL